MLNLGKKENKVDTSKVKPILPPPPKPSVIENKENVDEKPNPVPPINPPKILDKNNIQSQIKDQHTPIPQNSSMPNKENINNKNESQVNKIIKQETPKLLQTNETLNEIHSEQLLHDVKEAQSMNPLLSQQTTSISNTTSQIPEIIEDKKEQNVISKNTRVEQNILKEPEHSLNVLNTKETGEEQKIEERVIEEVKYDKEYITDYGHELEKNYRPYKELDHPHARTLLTVKGPVFISMKRYKDVMTSLVKLRSDLDAIELLIKELKKNKNMGTKLLKQATENIISIDESVKDVNIFLKNE